MPSFSAVLKREASDDQGTLGTFVIARDDNGAALALHSIELKWNDNLPNVSCIPEGAYPCTYTTTGKDIHGQKLWYLLSDTTPRQGILIHVGNYAGDVAAGLRSDTEGCILLGMSRGQLTPPGSSIPQKAVLQSTNACKELMRFTGKAPFTLRIE
jgi:hypothetical protein